MPQLLGEGTGAWGTFTHGHRAAQRPRLLHADAACSLIESIRGNCKQKQDSKQSTVQGHAARPGLGRGFLSSSGSPRAPGCLLGTANTQTPALQHADFSQAASASTAAPRKQSLKGSEGNQRHFN